MKSIVFIYIPANSQVTLSMLLILNPMVSPLTLPMLGEISLEVALNPGLLYT